MRPLLIILIASILLSCNDSPTNGKKQEPQKPITDSALTKPALDTVNQSVLGNPIPAYDSSKDKPGLDVITLPTRLYLDGDNPADTMDHFKYPVRLTMDQKMLDSLKSIANAYGAVEVLWLGPKDWKGSGEMAGNGGTKIDIYPTGGEELKGAHVMYATESSCPDCMTMRAAPYFKELRKDYEQNYNADGTNPLKIPEGIKVKRVLPSIVTYTLPDKDSLSTCGVVFYGTGTNNPDDEMYFTEALFVLPSGQAVLMDALVRWYVDKMSRVY